MQVVYAMQNETLDLICWRVLGRTAGVLEAVLEANKHIANFGAILPHGTKIIIPDLVENKQQKKNLIQLWD